VDFLHQLLWYFKPEGITYLIQTGGLAAICLIIFAETGFFALLPGDSLLVLCGIFAATPDPATGRALLPLWALLLVVPLCGILGDQVGYSLGRWAGRRIYTWREIRLLGIPLFKPVYLVRTEDFYRRWGVFTIVAGRWVPIVRTFAPIVAGVTRMPYSRFVPFNILGAFSWVWSMVLAGYFLPPLIHRVLPNFDLARNIDKIALLIVFLSVLPIAFTLWRERREAKDSGAAASRAEGKPEVRALRVPRKRPSARRREQHPKSKNP
jgi:membrane-associated protein